MSDRADRQAAWSGGGRNGAPSTPRRSAFAASRQAIDAIEGLRAKRLDHTEFQHLFFDVTYLQARAAGGLSRDAVVTTIGVTPRADAETLDVAVGDCESAEFWSRLLQDLLGRGLRGVEVVVCEPHAGLATAVATVLSGAAYLPTRLDSEAPEGGVPGRG